jgi:hypothetical protein
MAARWQPFFSFIGNKLFRFSFVTVQKEPANLAVKPIFEVMEVLHNHVINDFCRSVNFSFLLCKRRIKKKVLFLTKVNMLY